MKSPRSRSSFVLVFVAAASLGAFACGSSDDDTGLTQAIGGSAGAQSAAKGGSTSKGGTGGSAGTTQGKGGSATTGCGDLLACCISLDDPDDKSSCQATAAALADSENGAAQCQKALAAYQAQGLCEGGSSKGGSSGKGGTAGGGGSVDKGGASGKGGSAGVSGQGGAAGEGGGGDSGQGGADSAGQGGTSLSGAGGADAGGSGGEGQGGAGQGGSSAGPGGTSAGEGGSSAGQGGSDAGQAGAAGGPIELTLEAACQSWAEAICSKADSCGGIMEAYFQNVGDCVERSSKLDCPLRFATKSVTAPWSPAQIAACGAAWNTSSCSDLRSRNPTACDGHPGPRANGAGCTNDSECQSGFCDASGRRVFQDNEAACGTCVSPVPTEIPSTTCTIGSGCPKGLHCDLAAKACVRPRSVAQSCGGNVPCEIGAYCNSSQKCELQLLKGEACPFAGGGTNPCSGRFGLFCVNGKCDEATVAVGATCPNNGQFYCVADADCSDTPGGRKCALPLEDGAACSDGFPPFTTGDICRHPAICVNQKCTAAYTCGQ